jgi:hypothetical protein
MPHISMPHEMKEKMMSHLGKIMPDIDFSYLSKSMIPLPEGQVFQMDDDETVDEYGFRPLERMASDANLREVKRLFRAGANTLVHHHGLFPYHFASSYEIFQIVTHPPIEWRAYMLTLAKYDLIVIIQILLIS